MPAIAAGLIQLAELGMFPDAGEDIRIMGSGSAAVPAFDVTLKLHSFPKLGAFGPCADDAKGCELPAGDQPLSWTGGAGGHIRATVTPAVDRWPQTSVTCYFTADSGKGLVPGEALGKLPAGPYSLRITGVTLPVEKSGVVLGAQRWGSSVGITKK